MKKFSNILWGIVLVAVGVLLALNSLEILPFDLFFEGWWTLIIIIPCTIGLFTDGDRWGNIIGILIGVILLLWTRGIFTFDMLWKLVLPVIIILIGIKMIFGGMFNTKSAKIAANLAASGETLRTGTATFSEQDMNFDGEVFNGAELNAIFGGVKCDLRGAIIDRDCVINVTSIFGGITVLVPDNVNVKVNSNSIFGGMSNKVQNKQGENIPTVYISGTCMFGGVDIK